MALSAILGLVIGYVKDNRDFIGERLSSSSAPQGVIVSSIFNAEVRVSPKQGGSQDCNEVSINTEDGGSLAETNFVPDGRCLEFSLSHLCFLP
jgi:hypothetical protein